MCNVFLNVDICFDFVKKIIFFGKFYGDLFLDGIFVSSELFDDVGVLVDVRV